MFKKILILKQILSQKLKQLPRRTNFSPLKAKFLSVPCQDWEG